MNQNNVHEEIPMSEAIDDLAADVFSIYLHRFKPETTEEEKIERLAEMFNLSIHEIEQIIKNE